MSKWDEGAAAGPSKRGGERGRVKIKIKQYEKSSFSKRDVMVNGAH